MKPESGLSGWAIVLAGYEYTVPFLLIPLAGKHEYSGTGMNVP